MFKRSGLPYAVFLIIDISLTLGALRLARLLRETVPIGADLSKLPLQFSPWLYVIVPVIWMIVFSTLKIYNPSRGLRYTEDLPGVWSAIIGASLIFAGVAYLLFRDFSRLLFFYFILLDLIFLSSWRWLLPRFPKLTRCLYGAAQRRVLIVGTGTMARELARAIHNNPGPNLKLVGFADDDPENRGQSCAGYPVLGTFNEIPQLVHSHRLQEVIFALPPAQQPVLRSLVMALQKVTVNLRLVPDVFDLVFLRASVETFEGIPVIGLREPAIDGLDLLIKRLFDLMLSGLLLIILFPAMGIIALLIKFDSPGPIFFRQRRVGEGGHLFWMVKFRSMVVGAEETEVNLVQAGANGVPIFAKTPQDARVTRCGRVLRRTSLDELPQLVNVLKGEMSLVGPRPELPSMVDRYESWQLKRFAVPQGMTGWWQVRGRMKRADSQQRVEDDLFYIRHYSLWLDLRILWKTVQAVVQGEGAY